MKLISFRAENVHKSYNFNMTFDRDLNFIVGINGTGKTTALRLIQAALSFGLRELFLVSFTELSILLEQDNNVVELNIAKNNYELIFSLSTTTAQVRVPNFSKEELEQYIKTGRLDDYIEELRFKVLRESSPLSDFFKRVRRPVFLGLERRLSKDEGEDFDADEVRGGIRLRNNRIHGQAVRAGDQLIDGLDSSKRLIKNSYRKFRHFSDRQSEKLITVIVRSTFQYIGLADLNITDLKTTQAAQVQEYQSILERRKEIEGVALALGESFNTASQIDNFFDRLEADFNKMSRAQNSDLAISLEWLLNKAQIQRILEILKEIDVHKRRASALYAPIKNFVDTANFFFEHSRKSISVDSVGGLVVKLNDDDIPPSSLSSGERQLLILLAHVVFMPRQESDVIIIDEPELSLHLKWQENLVQKLVDLNSSKQFIFATHSPEIIGLRKDKVVRVAKENRIKQSGF